MRRLRAWRAALRLARRDAWRNKGRSALVAIMIAIPVLAASTVSVVYRSADRDPQDEVRAQLGTQAQAVVTGLTGGPSVQSPDSSDWNSYDSGKRTKGVAPEKVPAYLATVIPPRDGVAIDSRVYGGRDYRLGDRLIAAETREIDYAQPGLAGLIEQVSGRAPAAPGEVVVSRKLADDKRLKAGDRLTYTGASPAEPRPLTVVGVVTGLDIAGASQVIGRPGELIAPSRAGGAGFVEQSWLITGPDPVTWDQVLDLNQRGGLVLSRAVVANPPPADRVPYSRIGDAGADAANLGIGAVAIGLVLLQIALLAGPAIAVGARRNQRGLAIMASTGAEQRHLRAVVLATSGVIGVASSAVAAGLGALLGAGIVLAARHWFDEGIVRVDVRPLDLLGLVLVGGLTAIGASLVPARQAARLDVVAALTGRRGYAPPARRVPVVGALIVVAGVSLAVWASGQGSALLTVVAMAITEIGLITAIGAVVALAARGAVRLPFVPRFALRDAARQRGRTAPAVAAVMAAVAGGTAALVFVASQSAHDEQEYRPAAARGVVMMTTSALTPDELSAAEATLRRDLPIGTTAPIRGLPGDNVTYTFASLTRPPSAWCPEFGDPQAQGEQNPPPARPADVVRADPRCVAADPAGWEGPALSGMFDDGSVLQIVTGQRLPADVAALRAGKVITFDRRDLWPDGTVHVAVERSDASDGSSKKRTLVLPGQLSTSAHALDQPIYPLSAAKKMGYPPTVQGLVATTTHLPSGDAEDKAAAALQDTVDAGFTVERGYVDHYALGLLALVVAAAVVTLLGTFSAVGLAAAEGRADVATLAAVGASPSVRRRLAGAQAGTIAGLGTALGVFSGILAGWILVRVNRQTSAGRSVYDGGFGSAGGDWHLVMPWPHVLIVAVGIPLLTVVVGFLTTRSRLELVRRLGQ
jgi:putative ABC transport system permease protein